MLPPDLLRQLPYFVFILALFVAYGTLVRRGTITGRAILWSGALIGLVAVGAAVWNSQPYLYTKGGPEAMLFNCTAMALVTVYCVAFTYRTQSVTDLATYTLGDTKVILRSCMPARIPDADALLLPTTTSLRMLGPVAGAVALAAGGNVEKNAIARAPANIGKVVETEGGRLAVGKIYHVVVQQPAKPVAQATLRKGAETATLQARKRGAESLAVPLGSYQGLTPVQSMEAVVEGVLKHRKAFGEVVFIAFDARTGKTAADVLARVISASGGA